MRRMIALEVALLICTIALAMPVPAAADGTTKRCGKTGKCYVIAKDSKAGTSEVSTAPPNPSNHRRRSGNDRLQEARKKFTTAHAAYIRQLTTYNRCVVTFNPSSNPGGCGNRPTAPAAPMFRTNTFSGPGNPAVTAGQAAAIAVARLQLPTIAPGIGPSPNLNPWNMAAVGYPLWLWADGPTHVRVRSKHENCHGESRHLRQDLV